jgi:glycosyltransferase involved in cell wall biosynthesis
MKVVLLGTSHPFRGGLASYNERLALEFQNQGHEVEIWTFTVQYPSFLFPGKTQFSEEPAPEGITIKRIVNSVNPFNWLATGRKLKKHKADLIIVKYWLPFMGPCFGAILRRAKKSGATIISIIDNIIPHEKRFGDNGFTKYFVKPIDGFVTMSENVDSDLNQFDTSKPRGSYPHPIFDNFGTQLDRETALKKLELSTECRYLLFFGIIRDYKGLDWLLKAFKESNFIQLNLKLIVAGEAYTDEQKYRDLIKELDLTDHIIYHNAFVNDSDVKNYFCASDLIAQPYKNATQSGVTQIAYHFEKPMLVTNVGGLPEMVPNGKAGIVCETNTESITAGINQFFESDVNYEAGIKNEKQKYLWSGLTTTIFNLLDTIKHGDKK